MYWLKSPKINGCYSNFYVEENIMPRKYSRVNGKVKKGEKYWLIRVRKTGKTTEEMIKSVADFYKINQHTIGYAGLKDKNATTIQYITIPNKCNPDKFEKEDIEFTGISKTDKKLHIGDLISNKFSAQITGKIKNTSKLINEAEKRGIPNYFGKQRFGIHKDNHIIGKKIIIEKKSMYSKEKTKFYIHAYQSWIFNEALKTYIKKHKTPHFNYVKVLGYKTKLGNSVFSSIVKSIIKKEHINSQMFKIDNLRTMCIGSERMLFVKPENITFDNKIISFSLPKGSYGTVLLSEFGVVKC